MVEDVRTVEDTRVNSESEECVNSGGGRRPINLECRQDTMSERAVLRVRRSLRRI